ncbi:MAG TPA: nitronate monooxygenase [Stellaceae bacterium]|nr:nitronate monooxygenase [Stellaceae bacterium]
MRTALTERLGIELPIIQAPMGGAVGPRMAAAVSNAGGLGMLVPWRAKPETVRQQIRETRALTSRPFGVNLVIEFPQEERLAVCLEEHVPIISFFWGDPSSLTQRAKTAGAVVLHTVGSAAEAKRAVDAGVDIIVAQGWEAGGHVRGTVATLPLVPAVVDAVAPVPVVAAGGIADGRGLAAVLALGAAGAWIGTRFLACEEAMIHPRYRERLLAAHETDTVYLKDLFDVRWPNAPHRTLRNRTVEAWEAAGCPPSGKRPGEGEVIATSRSAGPVVRYQSYTPGPDAEGDIDALSLWAGQGVGLVSKVQSAGDIVLRSLRKGGRPCSDLGVERLFQISRRRIVAGINRLDQEFRGVVMPELTDLVIGCEDRVHEPAVAPLHLADMHVENGRAVFVEVDGADRS